MARFYGSCEGKAKTQATRLGSRNSGMVTQCASWSGAVRCTAHVDENGVDCVTVELIPWYGSGCSRLLYSGPMSGAQPVTEDEGPTDPISRAKREVAA